MFIPLIVIFTLNTMSILTHNAINTMLSLGNGAREKFIVEAYDVKVKAQWLQFTIGDGKNTLTATIILENDLRKVAKPVGEDSPKYFIKIIDFNCIELDRGSIIEI